MAEAQHAEDFWPLAGRQSPPQHRTIRALQRRTTMAAGWADPQREEARAIEMITLGTFNCENLFGRYKFRKDKKPTEDGGFTINNLAFEIYCEEDKHLTAQAIRATHADILGLQEVETCHPRSASS